MFRKASVRWLSFVLAVVMMVGMLPLSAIAAGSVTGYQAFLDTLVVLEGYADAYAAANPSKGDANLLVINFIRTGVDRYNDGNWVTLAGSEITEFTAYVEEQDAANSTNAMDLRDIVIDDFKLPNGDQVDFGHMFGTLNIAYVAAEASADLGGWAGDLCDLLLYSNDYGDVPAGTINEMADYIRVNCFGVNADDAFGMDDFYGDMDAFYLHKMAKTGNKLSSVMSAYFTADLSNTDRAAYFLNNRFNGLQTKEDVRSAILGTYTANTGIKVLEADRGLSDLSDLRTACCYAFADYLFDLAGDRLEGDTGDEGEEVENPYYSIFSSTESVLAPGITQTINYAQTADNKQIVYYVATVDVTRDDVTIMANYKDNNPDAGWGMQRVEDQANALLNNYKDQYENFNVIVATNADGYNMSTGQPGGLLVMGGVEWHPVDGDGFFAILKDGTAMIGTKDDYATYKDQIQEAVGAFGSTLVKDGKISITKTSNYYTSRASRTAIGITAEGKVVMMVLDGRQEPFSAGGSMEEIAQIMLDAGCVHAVNLDGGGSTTYLSKPEGADSLQLVNRPSDGYARSVATSLVAVSTAKSSKEFDHANIDSDYDYLTIGTTLNMSASGVSNTGNAAPIPDGAAWRVSDASVGTITADGVFAALANGEVEVQLVVDGNVVGSKKLYVVVPDALAVDGGTVMAIFGEPAEIKLVASYNGNDVKLNVNDIMFVLMDASLSQVLDETAGSFDGFMFIGNEELGLRNMNAVAILVANPDIGAIAPVSMYKSDEAVFDFENATAGNRTLAWLREVNNATTNDDMLYQIVTPGDDMDLEYTFGLDMTTIEIPSQLADLVFMLPGADTGATAWQFLLQLAERVSVLTEVRITVQLDEDLDVDISNLKVSNDYFYLKSAELGDNNALTIVCGWVDQTQAIDPATANPICILSGLKATPKDGASWDSDNQLVIKNVGSVSYKIYLRASSLYSFANKPENQAQYGLYPFENPDVIIGGTTEKGAYFGSTYADFEDSFILDKSALQGWQSIDGQMHYYVDHVPMKDCIAELPGQTDPENKYFYRFDANGMCTGKVSGLFELDGGLYYAINGVAQTSWQTVIGEDGNVNYYFFNTESRRAINGNQTIGGYDYVFENYILVRGDLVVDANGTRYMWAGEWATQMWLEIDGKIAYARSSSYFETGVKYRYSPNGDWTYYAFGEDGFLMTDFTGIYQWNGGSYLVTEGIVTDYPGLFLLDGDYYYISSTNVQVKNRYYWISKTNGYVPEGSYYFDADGKMLIDGEPDTPVVPDVPEEPDTPVETKNGIVAEEGTYYYYVNGVRTYAGVLLIDGYYYYARTTGEIVNNRNYWVTKTNGLLPERSYSFDAQGRITNLPGSGDDSGNSDPNVKNGIVSEYGGLYYYENGSRVYAGLIYLDGYFYYVRTSGQLAQSCDYWPTKTNGLVETTRRYNFDEQGRMIDRDFLAPGEVQKNGIYEEDGKLYYYVEGERNYAGLICIDGNWYYVRTSGEVARDVWYWPTKTNGHMTTTKQYYFDSNGVMQDPPAELLGGE